ncbi:TPA: hypothetical protein ACGD69_004064 [Serratia marcescens]|uniref:hypothetical protein n=1 Tax=Serratia marcescens TaxID=615 RepID=UPI002AB50378|nr:hypothetical protein [Serratia marcescens]
MDKFSELKAVAEKAKELAGINNYKKGKDAIAAFKAAANPAAILALLAENERVASDLVARNGEIEGLRKRAAELEAEITNIVDSHAETVAELRAKLATPIKIVNYDEFFICHVSGASDDYCKGWVDGRNAAARDVGKAGFTVEDKQ